jgi:hypothetical protein
MRYNTLFSKTPNGPWHIASVRERISLDVTIAELNAYKSADEKGWLKIDPTGTMLEFTYAGFYELIPKIYPAITPYIKEFSKIAERRVLSLSFGTTDFFAPITSANTIEEYIALKKAGYTVTLLSKKEIILYRIVRKYLEVYNNKLHLPATIIPVSIAKLIKYRYKSAKYSRLAGKSSPNTVQHFVQGLLKYDTLMNDLKKLSTVLQATRKQAQALNKKLKRIR